MNKNGPILIIEDDTDDQQFLAAAFKETNCTNELMFFADGLAAIDYLKRPETRPFLILCDINLPRASGPKVRKEVQNDPVLMDKCTPFLFFTTSASDRDVREAFHLSVQGFFVKPASYDVLVQTVKRIVDYWQTCCPVQQASGGAGR